MYSPASVVVISVTFVPAERLIVYYVVTGGVRSDR